jgi:hypothetical protein
MRADARAGRFDEEDRAALRNALNDFKEDVKARRLVDAAVILSDGG